MPTPSSTKAPRGWRQRNARRRAAGWRHVALIERLVAAGLVVPSTYEGVPLWRSPAPDPRACTFDDDAVERVVQFFVLLKHTVGRWAGTNFMLLDWQVEFYVAPVFGWKNADGWRVVRTVWFEIPRKNGKSTLASGTGLYLVAADREHGAEVYAAAGKKEQAAAVFRPARTMAKASLRLAARLKVLGNLIENERTGSFFRSIASQGDLEHGSNVHGALIDEVHVHKNRDIIDALETGTGARMQPLVVFITTADSGDATSIYAEKRGYAELVCKGTVVDPSTYVVVFGADKDALGFDPFADSTIADANPGAGITVQWDYLRGKANQARTSPGALNRYLRLHLNVRTGAHSAWFAPEQWAKGAGMVVEAELAGRQCYGGLDIASTSDFSAWCLLFPPLAGEECWQVLVRYWLPRAAVARRKDLQPMLEAWAAEGRIRITDGNVQDQAAIRSQLEADATTFKLVEAAYDPWNSGFMPELVEGGFPAWEIRQTVNALNQPCKVLERWVGNALLQHGGDPVLAWMVENVTLFTDSAGNIKPDKGKSHEKIDGVAALVDAIAAATREREVRHAPGTGTVAAQVAADTVYGRGGGRLNL